MHTHSNAIKLIVLIVFPAILFSCSAPFTKEAYLEKYENFIDRVSSEHSSFAESDWEEADEMFDKFNNEWYNKFEDELTWKEEILIKKLAAHYYYCKGTHSAKSYWDKNLKEDYIELQKKLEHYIENDMDEDVEALMEQAKMMGDSAMIFVEDVIEEIEEKRKR